MTTAVIIIALLFTVLIISYKAPAKKYKRKHKEEGANTPDESPGKAALNIPGYYEDIVNRDKLAKKHTWKLHDSF